MAPTVFPELCSLMNWYMSNTHKQTHAGSHANFVYVSGSRGRSWCDGSGEGIKKKKKSKNIASFFFFTKIKLVPFLFLIDSNRFMEEYAFFL